MREDMRSKQIDDHPKTYVLILETGEELASTLKQFATDNKLTASSFKAIGAFSSCKLGWFNWTKKKYETAVALAEQVELLSLIGDVALKDGKPQVHALVRLEK